MVSTNLPEPMVRLNHSGYGIKIKDLVTIATLIFVGGGAYFVVDYKLSEISRAAENNAVALQKATADLKATIAAEIEELEKRREIARVERNEDIRRLNESVALGAQDRARLSQKVDNLEDLMKDIRDFLRSQTAEPRGDNSLIDKDISKG